MAFLIQAGIQVSLNGTTWYKLTDHNRKEIQTTPELIEKVARMANGTMRKYVVAKKMKISTSWEMIPSQTGNGTNDGTVDSNYSSEWLEAFYNANVGLPIYVKIINAKETTPAPGTVPSEATRVTSLTGEEIYQVFITDFSTTVVWRTANRDFVNMNIEFTEI